MAGKSCPRIAWPVIVVTALLGCALIWCIVVWVRVSLHKPHIVFFLVDDLGWNDVGYHNPDMYTPTIDKLARQGVKLEHHYSQPFCTPSRAALLSGKYPVRGNVICDIDVNILVE